MRFTYILNLQLTERDGFLLSFRATGRRELKLDVPSAIQLDQDVTFLTLKSSRVLKENATRFLLPNLFGKTNPSLPLIDKHFRIWHRFHEDTVS